MYMGEVNVAQEELNSFLAVAEDLRVKGQRFFLAVQIICNLFMCVHHKNSKSKPHKHFKGST